MHKNSEKKNVLDFSPFQKFKYVHVMLQYVFIKKIYKIFKYK